MSVKLAMPWLLFIALVKIIEPIEGAKVVQMGFLDTECYCKEIPKYLKGIFQGICGCSGKEAKKINKNIANKRAVGNW